MRRFRGRLLLLALLAAGGCVRYGFGFGDDAAGPGRDGPVRDARAPNPDGPHGEGPLPKGDATPPTDADDGSPDSQVPLAGNVTGANDTCATPATIDLAPLGGGVSVSFSVDTSGAQADGYDFGCASTADVVVRLINAPGGSVQWSCTGGGNVGMAYHVLFMTPDPHVCPATFSGSSSCDCSSGTCSNSLDITTGTTYVSFCRDPSLGPVTVTLRR